MPLVLGPHRDFLFRVLPGCRWYLAHIGIFSFASYRDAVGTWPTLGFFSFASYRNAVIHLGSALGSILLQV